MRKKQAARLTRGEIEMLRMLWESGAVPLSEAHRAMEARSGPIGYTTVQTRLERLVRKGVVAKSRTRPTQYSASVSPAEVSGPLLDLLVQRVSGPVPLVAQLLEDHALSPEDLRELKRLIAEAERNLRSK